MENRKDLCATCDKVYPQCHSFYVLVHDLRSGTEEETCSLYRMDPKATARLIENLRAENQRLAEALHQNIRKTIFLQQEMHDVRMFLARMDTPGI